MEAEGRESDAAASWFGERVARTGDQACFILSMVVTGSPLSVTVFSLKIKKDMKN